MKKTPTILTILLVFCFWQPLKAQVLDTLNVAEKGFQILVPSRTLDAGESTPVLIILGESNNPVDNAMVFDIELELSGKVEVPDKSDFGFANSWFFNGASLDTVAIFDTAQSKVRLLGSSPTAKNGYGVLFKLVLFASENGTHTSEMILGGGGIVLIDDIGFKRSPWLAEEKIQASVYPNPGRGSVNFDWKGKIPSSAAVFDGFGREISILTLDEIAKGNWSHNLPAGSYFLIVNHGTNEAFSLPFLVE